jgi:serine/threonine-protein kinase
VVAGKYRIERELGAGGMGAVYLAVNQVLQRRVALKVMSDSFRSPGDQISRFMREAIAASQVRHPAIVEVFDAGQDGGLPWMAMELLEGENLEDRIERAGPLPPAEAVDIAREVLSALSAVHERGIVHRDIKPANIFLARTAGGGVQPKLLDFGIAKYLEGTRLTAAGSILGTAQFMAPEQGMDSAKADARADLYAVGAVLFNALSGATPYEASSFVEMIYKKAQTAPRDLAGLAPGLPRELVEIIRRCLEPAPEARPQTARELLDGLSAIEPLLSTSVSMATGPAFAPTQSAPVVPVPTVGTPWPQSAAPAAKPSRAGMVILLIVLGFLGLGVLVVPILAVIAISLGAMFVSTTSMSDRVQWNDGKRPMLVEITGDGVRDLVGWVRVLSAEPTHHLAAFDGASGDQLWITEAITDEAGSVDSRAAVAGDRLIVVDSDGLARGFDLSQGQQGWQAQLDDQATEICAHDPQHVLVMTSSGGAQRLDLATGATASVPAGTSCLRHLDAHIEYSGGGYFPSGLVQRLEAAPEVPGMNAESAWLEPSSSIVLVLGTRAQGEAVPMVAAARGEQLLWSQAVPGSTPGRASRETPSAADLVGDRLAVAYSLRSGGHRLAAFELASGRQLWDVEIPDEQGRVRSVQIDSNRVVVTHWCWLDVFDLASGSRLLRIGRWQ